MHQNHKNIACFTNFALKSLNFTRVLEWSEIKLLSKSKNSQAGYGSMIIHEQLLSKVFGHGLRESLFLHNKMEDPIDMNRTPLS